MVCRYSVQLLTLIWCVMFLIYIVYIFITRMLVSWCVIFHIYHIVMMYHGCHNYACFLVCYFSYLSHRDDVSWLS